MKGSNNNCKWLSQGADHDNGLDNLGKSKSSINYIYNLPLSTVAPHNLQLYRYVQHDSTSTRYYKS